MAELLVAFGNRVIDADGTRYVVRALGGQRDDGRWEGWLEFVPEAGGPARRTMRETTQANRENLMVWAAGLEPVYLDGALARATARAERRPGRRAA